MTIAQIGRVSNVIQGLWILSFLSSEPLGADLHLG